MSDVNVSFLCHLKKKIGRNRMLPCCGCAVANVTLTYCYYVSVFVSQRYNTCVTLKTTLQGNKMSPRSKLRTDRHRSSPCRGMLLQSPGWRGFLKCRRCFPAGKFVFFPLLGGFYIQKAFFYMVSYPPRAYHTLRANTEAVF